MNSFAQIPEPPEPSAPDGEIEGHPFVDLGLPSGTLWAMYNVGASSPTEYGDYFCWGEVSTKDIYTWETYEFVGDYIYDPRYGSWYTTIEIGDEISGTEYDAARHNWGGVWRLPTAEEVAELVRYTWRKWKAEDGVIGVRLYGPNENSIFIPANGYADNYNGQTHFDQGYYGYFWSGTQTRLKGYPESANFKAGGLYFDSGGVHFNEMLAKEVGNGVRPMTTRKELTAGIAAALNKEGENVLMSYSNGCLKITGNTVKGKITVQDTYGRMVFTSAVNGNTCRLPSLQNGMYIVSLSDGKKTVKTQKMIIN